MQQVLLTHWHGDHVGGVSDLKGLCPQAIVHKHDPEDGQEDIYDGQVFCVEGATLKACHTPGHTYDHMAFIIEEEDALITGDSGLPPVFTFRLPGPCLLLSFPIRYRCPGSRDKCV